MRDVVVVRMLEYQVDIVGGPLLSAPTAGGLAGSWLRSRMERVRLYVVTLMVCRMHRELLQRKGTIWARKIESFNICW